MFPNTLRKHEILLILSQHSPSSWRMDVKNSQLANHGGEALFSQWFSEDISKLFC